MSQSGQGITESGNTDQFSNNRNSSGLQKEPSEDRCRCSGVKNISIMEEKIYPGVKLFFFFFPLN